MATSETTQLKVKKRNPNGSREARRLRHEQRVPGVLYGGGDEPMSFDVDARELRLALALLPSKHSESARKALLLKPTAMLRWKS